MMSLLLKRSLTLAACLALVAVPALAVQINEIRLDQTGADADEYIELVGTPSEALDGLWLVVIGDGTGGCGVIESVVDFTGYSIQADGFAAFTDSDTGTDILTGYDYILAGNGLNFENGDDITYLLVRGFTGANGNDLDTDNDGTLDSTPWSAIVDEVGVTEALVVDCTTNEYLYTSVVVGPDGTFVPGHIYRCSEGWRIGPFDPTVGKDTPGAANDCTVPVATETWTNVKNRYH